MHIISASRRTDIPAFYANDFLNLLKQGFCTLKNPYNPKQTKNISLLSKDIEGIVFWTKHPQKVDPLLNYLKEENIPYYFHYTLNHYPHFFEDKLPSVFDRIEKLKKLSDNIGKEKVIWRYDPIIISSHTPGEFHLEQLDFLMKQLSPFCRHLTISFISYYKKTVRKLKQIKTEGDLQFYDALDKKYNPKLNDFIKKICLLSQKYALKIKSCALNPELREFGLESGKCIDASIFNGKAKKDANQRPFCNCDQSFDIGEYNSCLWDCRYCYACR